VNPPLVVADAPSEAVSLALVVDDPDAVEPAGKVWDHWLVWNVDPTVGQIPEDWSAIGAVEGRNDFGENDYGGPNPPDGPHSYRFRLYALDTTLELEAGATKSELDDAMTGHALARAELHGTYAP
jgi:Raf kinase inhibitor-like YbhB/YbcL family protein